MKRRQREGERGGRGRAALPPGMTISTWMSRTIDWNFIEERADRPTDEGGRDDNDVDKGVVELTNESPPPLVVVVVVEQIDTCSTVSWRESEPSSL